MGQSAAVLSGARVASGEALVFMDGDGQNDPADIARLAAAYREKRVSRARIAVLGQRAEASRNTVSGTAPWWGQSTWPASPG